MKALRARIRQTQTKRTAEADAFRIEADMWRIETLTESLASDLAANRRHSPDSMSTLYLIVVVTRLRSILEDASLLVRDLRRGPHSHIQTAADCDIHENRLSHRPPSCGEA
jgi:predicted Zn-dependent protease